MAITSTSSINWIDLIFVQFICTITVLGTLINFIEPHLPIIVTQTFRYGKHSYKGAPSRFVQNAEIPKSFFRHFYVFALLLSSGCMWLVAYVYIAGHQTPDTVLQWLDLLCGSDRQIRCKRTLSSACYIYIFLYYYCSNFPFCSESHNNVPRRAAAVRTVRAPLLRDTLCANILHLQSHESHPLCCGILPLFRRVRGDSGAGAGFRAAGCTASRRTSFR